MLLGAAALSWLLLALPPAKRWLAPLFMGVGLMSHGVRQIARARSVRHWHRSPARIVGGELVEVFVGGHTRTEYLPRIRFEYASLSGWRESHQLTVAPQDHRTPNRAEAQRWLDAHPVGAAVQAWVCPGRDEWAVLLAEVSARRTSQNWAITLGGLMVACVGASIPLFLNP
ncbi:MAG: DUF3592 domain-containing protein [Burkholderiales bacterium]|nr:DUF3592 domain-containing protein [Burkholderiales bacterium]MBH2015967.1 DUF3592 domain-containing protein [Burkholderiales bacterium]